MIQSMRKLVQGVLGFVIAALVAVSLVPAAAFADYTNTGDLTVTGVAAGDSVSVYKVVKTTYDKDTNEFKLDGFVGNYGVNWDEYQKATSDSNGVAAYANTIASAVKTAGTKADKTETATGDSVEFTGLDAGQYLVVVTPAAGNAGKVYQNTIASVLPVDENGNITKDANGDYVINPVTVSVKQGAVSITKGVRATESDAFGASVDTVSRGGKVYYQITTTLPRYAENAKGRTFKIDDAMPSDITLDGKVTVKVDGTEVSAQDVTVNNTSVEFSNAYLIANGGKQATITYAGKLSDTIKAGTYKNTATLTYSTDSTTTATATAAAQASVIVYSHNFKKVKKDSSEGLSGAEFEVYQDSALKNKIGDTLTSAADGTFSIDGLGAGTYYLKETKAPTGYKIAANGIEFTVKANDTSVTTIENEAMGGLSLPKTGGAGTIALTAAGVVIMAGAAVFIVRGRKQD